MKNIIIFVLVTGLTGCQLSPSLTADKLSKLSNEDLCRALGTYNNNGGLVLKIYDELKVRPEKIDIERCYILEKLNENQGVLESKGNPLHSEDRLYQQMHSKNHKKTINYKNKKIDASLFNHMGSIPQPIAYENIFNQKKHKNKSEYNLGINEEKMRELMNDCLKKHVYHPHIENKGNK